jgi:hypothetical protein
MDTGEPAELVAGTVLRKRTAMRSQKSMIARGGLFAVLVLVLLAPALTGCGIGPATNQEKISKTATTYLMALADGDVAKACAQLTHRAQGQECPRAMRVRLARLDSDALGQAAGDSMDIDVHGDTATAALSEPEGARLHLVKGGDEWRIDSGYTLG